MMVRRMAGLAKLRRLHFQILMMPAFAGLGDLKQLEGLSIMNTDAAGDALQVLGNLVHLKSLGLGDKYFTDRDLARLAPLHDLNSLSLGGHWKVLDGSAFEKLSPLTHLTSLDLDGLGIQDEALASIAKLVTLEELGLSRTWITAKGLASLVPLSRLKTLRLTGCRRVGNSSLEVLTRFPHLESLSLNDCSINESAVGLLKKLTSLRELSVDPTHLSPAAYQDLFYRLPNCNINGARPFLNQQRPAENQVSSRGTASLPGGFGPRRERADRGRRRGEASQIETKQPYTKPSNGNTVARAQGSSQVEDEASDSTKPNKKASPEVELLDRMNKETSPDRAIALWVQAFEGDFGIEGNTFVRAPRSHSGRRLPHPLDFSLRPAE